MADSPRYTPNARTEISFSEKKSTFIGCVDSVDSPQDVSATLDVYALAHPTANHRVWAYLCDSAGRQTQSCNDDGEPRGTAGMPVLRAIQYSGMVNVLVVVVRYFGGTKLGAGGLVRAYGRAASLALEATPRRMLVDTETCIVTASYASIGALQNLFSENGIEVLSEHFSEDVEFTVRVARTRVASTIQAIMDVTRGNASISRQQNGRIE